MQQIIYHIAGPLSQPSIRRETENFMENKPFVTELEQRFGARIPFNQEVLVNNQTFGTIRDMSVSGCFIETRKIFGLGQTLSLRFTFTEPTTTTVLTSARVVNVRPGNGIGVKFEYCKSPDLEDTVQKLVAHVLNAAQNKPSQF